MPAAAETVAGQSIVLVGAGNMGGALLDAWLDSGIDPRCLQVIDPQAEPGRVAQWVSHGVRFIEQGSAQADVLVLAIKPQMLGNVAPELVGLAGPSTLLISVVAGKTIADLQSAFPEVGAIARAMPNTPAAIRRGITGVAVDPRITAGQRATIQMLLEAVGDVEWAEYESLIDAVTAVSGSGPAYVFFLTECLAAAGVTAGLAPATAMRLARATVEGAGALMAARRDVEPAVLRQSVTSPGGTTAAALDVLMRADGLSRLMTDAVIAARRRAGELAG